MPRLPLWLRLLRRFEFPRKLGLLDRVYGRGLSGLGTSWVLTSNGRAWRLNLRDASHRWIVYGIYEGRAWLDWLRGAFRGGGVVIESGANIGQTLLYYADWPGVKVYGFEPNPACAEWLGQCLDRNPDLHVEVVQCGLASEAGSLELQLAGSRSTMIQGWYRDKGYERIHVPVVRLDAFARERGVERIAFWKLDVEGFELDALKGASTLLQSRLIDRMLIEAVGDSYPLVKQYLESVGYDLFLLSRNGRLMPAPEHLGSFQNVVSMPRKDREPA